MARSKAANEAISDKVQVLLREGYPTSQAQAIAFRMYRDGELRYSKPPKKRRKGHNQNKVKAALKFLGLAAFVRKKSRKR